MAMTKRIKTIHLHNRKIVAVYTAPDIPADRLRCPHSGGHSTPSQQKYNRKKSLEKKVLKAINTFIKGCFFIVYTYNDENLPKDAEDAYKDLNNVIRGTKRLYAEHGLDCPYIGVVEYGEQFGRLHCHTLYAYTRDIDFTEIKAKWKKGNVYIKFVPFSQVESWTQYVLKAPLKETVSKKLKAPKEDITDITEAEYKEIIESPTNIEAALPGYTVSNIEAKQFTGWAAIFNKVIIQLKSNTYVKGNLLAMGKGEFTVNTA